jgi:hypothetical protein
MNSERTTQSIRELVEFLRSTSFWSGQSYNRSVTITQLFILIYF